MALCPPVVGLSGKVVVVFKAAYALGLYEDGALAAREGASACVDVALGADPLGDKARRGDERTPEGEFHVTHRNPTSRFTLSLGLDYPRARHAEAAYAAGRIDRATRDAVVAAERDGKRPPQHTPLGGDLFLHGGGSWPKSWTDGCVAMADADIRWLYAEAGPGTRVVILP